MLPVGTQGGRGCQLVGPHGITVASLQCFKNENCRCGCQGDPPQPRLTEYLVQGDEYRADDGQWLGAFCVGVWATSAAQALDRFAAAARRRRNRRYVVRSLSMVPEVYDFELGRWAPHLYEPGQPLVGW